MKITNTIKITRLLAILLISFLTFTACSDDDDHDHDEGTEEELITTVRYTLTNGNNIVTLTFSDPDGEGGNDGTYSISGDLDENLTYTGLIELLNETESPAEDITEEVLEEALEHQFFFTPTNGIATVAYTDTDSEGNPVGIQFTLTTTDAGSGTITISLVHEPEKTEPGVSSGDITNAEGETDIDATFSIVVQ